MEIDPRFLDARPQRALDWEEDEKGQAVVFRPRFGNSAWGRRLARWLGSSDYRIRLDPIGTLIWKSSDGDTSVSTIIERLRGGFGDRIEPAEERVYRFVQQLSRSRLIRF